MSPIVLIGILLVSFLGLCNAVSLKVNTQDTLVELPSPPIPPGIIFSNGTIFYNNVLLTDTNSDAYKSARNITECAGVVCQNEGVCSYGVCQCVKGFSGNRCEINPCVGVFCPFNQRCVEGKCITDACSGVVCQNDGKCNASSGTCECVKGFTGMFCQIDPCSLLQCLNGGICTYPGVCQCRNGFFGDTCEKDACSEGSVVCQNGGRCVYGKCYCSPEWVGATCDVPSDAAKDHYLYTSTINASEDKLRKIYDKFLVIANATDPRRITLGFKAAFEHHEQNMIREAEEKAKQDWMAPKVIGFKPVFKNDLSVPKTSYENAQIYEDQEIAYRTGHEVRYRPLIEARDLVNRTLQQQQIDRFVIAKPVPGAQDEMPFGRFAEIRDKYNPLDSSLLDQDLASHRSAKAALAQSILDAEDLLI